MWEWMLLQNAAKASSWYNGALLVAASTAAATFVLGQVSAWRMRNQARRDSRMALLSAFYAEVTVIRNELRPLLRDIVTKLEAAQPLLFSKWGKRTLPTVVYKENAQSLGEVGDSRLVERIVTLYSRLEAIEEGERLLLESEESLSPDNLEGLVAVYRLTQVSIFGIAAAVSYTLANLVQSPQSDANTLEKQFNEDVDLSEKAGRLLEQFLGIGER